MSVIHTESWGAFPQFVGDDTSNAVTNAARLAMTKSMPAAGYSYQQASNLIAWLVRPHPVFAERSAIVFSASNINQNGQSAFRKKVGDGTGVIVGGFSLFVPLSFKPDTGTNARFPMLTVAASNDAASLVNVFANGNLGTNEIFRVRYDLSIGYGPSELQNSKKIVPGKMAYIEYRLTQSEVRIWLDDVLVLQKSIAVNNSNISFSTINWGGTSGFSGLGLADGQWAISDWYNLKEDTVAPNVRLGPATRVIGVKAASDSFTQFARPSSYPSNAAVTAQPLNPDTTDFLKTDLIGAQDIYNQAASDTVSTAAFVYAQSTKIYAQNTDSLSQHTMSPLIISSGVTVGTSQVLPSNVGLLTSIASVDPATGEAWEPAAAAAAKFGMKLES